jgi:arylsulfatase A-like enzyme
MDRRNFIKTVGLTLSAATFASNALASSILPKKSSKKPNIVVFYADDLGYADVGYHGNTEVPTPNIDYIANNGAQFSTGYVTAPVCAPSRIGLITGRYQQRFGAGGNPGPYRETVDTKIGVPDDVKTFGHRMQEQGYKTAFIGKHHSGMEPRNNPLNLGFDYFYGFDNGAALYFKSKKILEGHKPVDVKSEYLTDAFGDKAVQFIDKHQEEPFFVYLAFNAVHGPMQAQEKLLKKYSHVKDPGRQKLLAMLESLDTNIGKVLEKLRTRDLEDNTLIFFISDNGGDETGSNFSYNYPLRDKKGSFYEGGIRVPFCVKWKDHIKPGTKIDFPVITLDVLPTLIAATNNEIDPAWKLDGINLLPYLNGSGEEPPERFLYWQMGFGWAIRDNTWKLVRPWGGNNGWGSQERTPELYTIANDIKESNNLTKTNPKQTATLQKQWDTWKSQMKEEKWGWSPATGPKVPFK